AAAARAAGVAGLPRLGVADRPAAADSRAGRGYHSCGGSRMPELVADVGNTRVKWGLLAPDEAGFRAAESLPPDEPDVWARQLAAWEAEGLNPEPRPWVAARVQPTRLDRPIDSELVRGNGKRLLNDQDEH